jgi:hypothetical protein
MEGIVKTRGQGSESLRVRSPQRTFRSSNCNELIRFPSFEAVGSSSIIDPRYEWSIFSGPRFQTPAKPASDWLDKKARAVSCGRIHVTNFKTPSSTKALQKLCTKLYQSPAEALHEAPYEALQKLYQRLYQRLCNTSTHPVY